MRFFYIRNNYYRVSDKNAKILSTEWGGLPRRGINITVDLPNGCKASLIKKNFAYGDRNSVWCIYPDQADDRGAGVKQNDGTYICLPPDKDKIKEEQTPLSNGDLSGPTANYIPTYSPTFGNISWGNTSTMLYSSYNTITYSGR